MTGLRFRTKYKYDSEYFFRRKFYVLDLCYTHGPILQTCFNAYNVCILDDMSLQFWSASKWQ